MRASGSQIESFAQRVARRLGQRADEACRPDLAHLVSERALATGCASIAEYLDLLDRQDADEWRRLAERTTVVETFFWRSPEQIEAFAQTAIPQVLRAASRRPVRVLSAGCASGEEPASLAISLWEAGLESAAIAFEGFDINPQALERARNGRYSAWSLRQMPAELAGRYLRQEGDVWVLCPTVRARISYHERNLLDDDPGFWHAEAFEVIMCRNVLMYFPVERAAAVLDRLVRSLVPGGYLFLGHAESMRAGPAGLELRQHGGAFFYQRTSKAPDFERPTGLGSPSRARIDFEIEERATAGSGLAGGPWPSPEPSGEEFLAGLRPAPQPPLDDQVMDEPACVSTRVPVRVPQPPLDDQVMDEPPPAWPAIGRPDESPGPSSCPAIVAAPTATIAGHDEGLLRAIRRTDEGDLARAAADLDRLLDQSALDPRIHYQRGVCHEYAGQTAAAMARYRMAAYLDPSFAMPHLALGRIAVRQRDGETARRELRTAMELLQQEEESHLSLFGGGLGRAALIGLCRGELRRLARGP